MSEFSQRLRNVIPGGAHTYARGDDQYPSNAPSILEKGSGAYVFDPSGKKFLDYGMGLRTVTIGYAEESVNRASLEQISKGNNLTRPSTIELEAAELLTDLIKSVDMVKFTKNGSTAVTAAVKLARAYTGRDLIVRCADHPFFSYDDWFIGSTPITKGIPINVSAMTKTFEYNNLESLEKVVDQHPGEIACVVLEPATTEDPKNDFLKKVKALCHKNGIVFILDEMITGFRWDLKSAQKYYGVEADLCTFGKGMANGFSVACVAGCREIMDLGSIEPLGRERVFLLSTTHGAEMSSLGAFVATVEFLQKNPVLKHLWDFGARLQDTMRTLAKNCGLENSFKVFGFPCCPYYLTLDQAGKQSLPLRTLFLQEMVANGVLMPWISICYRHGEEELRLTEDALEKSFIVYKKALDEGVDQYLRGSAVKPVFRKFN